MNETQFVKITKTNDEKRLVYGVVYAPNQIDTHGEFMTSEEIEKMAHRFMKLQLRKTIDVNHNQVPIKSYPVESYIVDNSNSEYPLGAWVVGVKIEDDSMWQSIKNGNINGFSFQAMVRKVPRLVEIDVAKVAIGEVELNDNHSHFFFVELDDKGTVKSGKTSIVNGHSHDISNGTATAESSGHSHRFFI